LRVPLLELSKLMSELEENDVFSRTDDGTIFSRRMERDEEKHLRLSELGQKGQRVKQQKSQGKRGALSHPSSHPLSTPSNLESESEEESERTLPVIPPNLGGPKILLPDDWKPGPLDPTDEPAAHRIESEWDDKRRQSEIDSFRLNHRTKGSRYSDWQSIWAGWVRNAEKFDNRDARERTKPGAPAPRSHADVILEEAARLKPTATPAEPERKRAGASQ
jgi:hypothetical protein